MVYLDQIVHTYVCQHSLTTGMQNHLFVMTSLLSISPACSGQIVKMLITLEPCGIFGSKFAYIFIIWLARSISICRSRPRHEGILLTLKILSAAGLLQQGPRRDNLSSGFLTKRNSNQSPQLQGLAR